MRYHLDLTLKQRATLSLAISIWNHQKVKNKISKSSHILQQLRYEEMSDEWKQLMKEVLKEVNEDLLPPPLRGELFHVVKALGEKILCWYCYINSIHCKVAGEQGNIIDYIGEIYWTPIGTIDEVKILKSYWLKNPNLNVAVSYYIACTNALEGDIDDLWQKIPNSIKNRFDKFSPVNYDMFDDPHYDFLILVYWKYRRDGQMDHFGDFISPNGLFGYEYDRFEYNRNYSLNYNMFVLSVFQGYSTAVKYFWKKLTQRERNISISCSAYMSVLRSYYIRQLDFMEYFIHEKYVEIIIFLINQMTVKQKKLFLGSMSITNEGNFWFLSTVTVKTEILLMLLSIWPWQELITTVLNWLLRYLEHNTELVSEALLTISRKIVKPSYAVENIKLRSMLHEVWFIIQDSTKRMIIKNLDDDIDSNFMIHLLEVKDLGCIKMIFDDPEIADIRMELIKIGENGYELLIKSNEYEWLNQFMEMVLRSEEEKIYFKSLINHIKMCEHFINIGRYDSVDKLLNWKFETIEERRQCKNFLKDYDLLIDFIFLRLQLHEGSVDKAKEETSRFLEWLLESEDDISSFKKEVIVEFESQAERKVVYEEMIITLCEEQAEDIRQVLT